MSDWLPDRAKFKDHRGHTLITQNLFIDFEYDESKAIYTWRDEDCVYKGRTYVSLRRLYLEMADPTEYKFACKYLLSWEHWLRIAENKNIQVHIQKWRDELEVKLRSQAVGELLKLTKGSFNAAKWAADGGWNQKRGRPSKEEVQREAKMRSRAVEELSEDSSRVLDFIGRKEKMSGS